MQALSSVKRFERFGLHVLLLLVGVDRLGRRMYPHSEYGTCYLTVKLFWAAVGRVFRLHAVSLVTHSSHGIGMYRAVYPVRPSA